MPLPHLEEELDKLFVLRYHFWVIALAWGTRKREMCFLHKSATFIQFFIRVFLIWEKEAWIAAIFHQAGCGEVYTARLQDRTNLRLQFMVRIKGTILTSPSLSLALSSQSFASQVTLPVYLVEPRKRTCRERENVETGSGPAAFQDSNGSRKEFLNPQ